MRAPDFWFNPETSPGWEARALAPVAAVVAAAARLRQRLGAPLRLSAPVICVGNIVVGGAGKTPTVLALCDRLAALGATPHILARGYGGRLRGPHRVTPRADSAEEVGDEPLLMARRRTTWIGRDRRLTGQAAIDEGADVLVMDDGFQNPQLEKDLSFVVVDAQVGHGNGRVLPAGPLRETLADGFARADAVVLVGDPPGRGGPSIATPPGKPVLHARISPVEGAQRFRGRPVVAFAGIGRPEKFFETLRSLGAELLEAEAFDDHQMFSPAILRRLAARADALGAELVTTEKDHVRLPTGFEDRVRAVPISLGFSDPGAVDALLRGLITSSR